jgi:two-component system, OmpR family, sensor histidine kinase CreC
MRIRTAIFGVYVLASALGFAVLMAFILREVRPRHVESMRNVLADTASLLAVLLEADMEARPEADMAAAWRKNLAALERASGALRVYVTDARGIVAFDSAAGHDVGRDYTRRPEVAEYFKRAYEESKSVENVDLAGGELRVTATVKKDGKVVGLVGVARPLSSFKQAILRARLRLVAGGLAVALVMTAAGWWIASRVTHSIERLTLYVEAVRDGRAGQVPKSRAREVEALSRAFEEMRAALEGKAHVERTTQALAHELKAPLAAVRGAAELLAEPTMPDEERARFLGNLCTESARIERLVDRMLRLAVLEARRRLETVEAIDLAMLVGTVVKATQAEGACRALRVNVEVSETPIRVAAKVSGERLLLEQAVGNLLRNAIEFSPKGGMVNVSVQEESRRHAEVKGKASGGWAVVIEDDGEGVPEFARERIFERFYSLPRPLSGRKSTGLGLSFVREIAALHDGEVTVVNRAAGGARAVLWLPKG